MCTYCGNDIPLNYDFCPHCGQPAAHFPNVRAASASAEVAAVDARYQAACSAAGKAGTAAEVAAFEAAVANSVIVRNVGELEIRSLASGTTMTSTFEKMLGAEALLKGYDVWTQPRLIAGASLFPGYQGEIRFAAIAVGPVPYGVLNYGPFALVLREEMVAHRSSVFETNSARIVKDAGLRPGGDLMAAGHRATWPDRARLAVAKIANSIKVGVGADEHQDLLISQGPTSADDEFIEVHIYRPITIRAVSRVLVKWSKPATSQRRPISLAIMKAVKKELSRARIPLEIH
jgi:hypothetical protein